VKGLTIEQYTEIIKAKEQFYKSNVSYVKINTCLLRILNETATSHKSYIVTNATKDRATYTLNYIGVENKFEKVISIEDDQENLGNKYLLAISKINVDPSSILVFENEDIEIANAIEAGILKSNIVKV
jgi:beta-phosphoglucomutase-like phosphatase (HAD superfamily)